MSTNDPSRSYSHEKSVRFQTNLDVEEHNMSSPGPKGPKLQLEYRPGDDTAKNAALICMGVHVAVTWAMVLLNNPSSLSWFAFHPPLQSLAMALFTYGILTLQPTSQPKSKAAGLTRHQLYMLVTGLPVISVGTWAIYHTKNLNSRPHLISWHGTLGAISFLWMIGQIAIGAGSVWFGGAAFGGGMKAKSLWKYHRLSGYALYPLFLFTAHLGGAWSAFSTGNSSYIVRLLAYTVAPGIALVAIYSRVRTSKMRFF